MPASTYPVVSDPKTCRHCRERVASTYFCLAHPRTCMTCCCDMRRRCGLEPWDVPTPYFPNMTREERDADMAQIRCDLGFRPETDAEIAENAERREQR